MAQHHNSRDWHSALTLPSSARFLPKCSSSFLSVSHSSLHPPSSSRAPSLQHCFNRKVRVGGSVLREEYVPFMSLCSVAVNCCICVDWIMIGLQRWAPSFPTALCLFVHAATLLGVSFLACSWPAWLLLQEADGGESSEAWMDFRRFFTHTTFVYPHYSSFLCVPNERWNHHVSLRTWNSSTLIWITSLELKLYPVECGLWKLYGLYGNN